MAETFIAQHVVSGDDTLSRVALKYYGSAAREMWMKIYEANKDVIGPNPNVLRPGITLKIPPKTEQPAQAQPAPEQPKPAAPEGPSVRGGQAGKGKINPT